MTTRLQCPECRMELLPTERSAEETHITCCRCGRDIYLESKRYVRVECPKCSEAVEGEEETNLAECCCP